MKLGWSTLIVGMNVVEDGGGCWRCRRWIELRTKERQSTGKSAWITCKSCCNRNTVRMKLNTRTEDNVISQIRAELSVQVMQYTNRITTCTENHVPHRGRGHVHLYGTCIRDPCPKSLRTNRCMKRLLHFFFYGTRTHTSRHGDSTTLCRRRDNLWRIYGRPDPDRLLHLIQGSTGLLQHSSQSENLTRCPYIIIIMFPKAILRSE